VFAWLPVPRAGFRREYEPGRDQRRDVLATRRLALSAAPEPASRVWPYRLESGCRPGCGWNWRWR